MIDVVIQVFAGEKSKKIIDAVLEEFLPGYEPLDADSACKPDDEQYVFASEEEMIRYFTETPGLNGTFYWNKYVDNPDRIMVGAVITSDNQLIMSLTVDGDDQTIDRYFNQLKTFLQSPVGVITHFNPADYEDGLDFIERYS